MDLDGLAGTLAPVVALGGIVLASLLDPTFAWLGDALSDLGVRPRSAAVFNGALLLGGLMALVYAVGRWRDVSSRRVRLVLGLFGLSAASLAGVGVFPAGHPFHAPAAVGFYALVTLTLGLDGVWRRESATGRATIALAVGQVGIWGSWLAGWWPGSGLALPEFAGALLVPVWIWWTGPCPTLRRADQSIAM